MADVVNLIDGIIGSNGDLCLDSFSIVFLGLAHDDDEFVDVLGAFSIGDLEGDLVGG
ncbi:hypothetical protein QCA50_012883 [Cerrena zonata]|uniref:Uncharacterized protein n=1 Tax=Cerrena zonata TaxID=2478898 RepID=A0AAW0FX69_9APHY